MTTDANAEQRDYWNGADSREWVVEADRYDAMLAPFGDILLDAAALTSGSRVLDVGCGNGATTLAAARRVESGAATGVDISAPMLETARRRAAARGVPNASFMLADAQTDAIGGPFDAAISRFGIMFFADPVAAFANIRAALAPGGRATFLCWRQVLDNEWVIVPNGALLQHVPPVDLPGADAPGPFRFGEGGSLESALSDAGFVDVSSEAIDTSMLVGGPSSFDDAFAFISENGITRRFITDVPDDVRTRALSAMRDALVPYQTDEGIRMNAAVWLVRGRT